MAKHPLSRRAFLAGSAALAAGCATVPQRSEIPSRPNIIYAFSDEHRYQSMSFTELPELQTPAMAWMAREGCHFTNCISNYPVCSPHRAILLTSRWPYQTGVIDNGLPLNPGEMTVGKAFQAAGYRTGYIGKWHLVGERAEPFGFEHSLIWTNTNDHWNSLFHPPSGAEACTDYNATVMTDQALEFLDTRDQRPFFLMISWNPPHANFLDPPAEKLERYPEGSLPFRPNFRASEPGAGVLQNNGSPYYEGYHGHIDAIDDELGRLVAALDAQGLWENTLLIYSSDHGSMHGSHGVGSKRQPYEESIRVPFLVCGPGVARGQMPDALLGTPDIMPTLCGLAGIEVPETCQGQDFSAWIRGGRGPDPERALIMHVSKDHASGGAQHPAPLFRGLRTKRHTYAVGVEGPLCLFDNLRDPYQMNNLLEMGGHEPLRAEMHAFLQEDLRALQDPFELRETAG